MATFAEILVKLRKGKNLTQPEFAKEIGISASTVASWETGRRMPKIDTLIQIANYFDVKTAYLKGEDINRIPGDDDAIWCDDEVLEQLITDEVKKLSFDERFIVYDCIQEIIRKRQDDTEMTKG